MQHRLVPLLLEIIVLSGAVAVAAPPVKHPNLLLNRDEIEQVKAKIAKYPWAAAVLEKTKEHALNGPAHENGFLDQAIYYTFTGDKSFADRARAELLGSAKSELPAFQKLDMAKNREFGSWSPWGARAWTYDLIYETCSDAERARIEEWFRVSCRVLMDTCKQWTTTPNLMFGKHVNIGLVGYCLGDREIIDWVLNDPGAFGPHVGGFYPVMDSMIKDGRFWAEAPIYALVYDVPNMLALAEAARHYDGTDLYHWVAKKKRRRDQVGDRRLPADGLSAGTYRRRPGQGTPGHLRRRRDLVESQRHDGQGGGPGSERCHTQRQPGQHPPGRRGPGLRSNSDCRAKRR